MNLTSSYQRSDDITKVIENLFAIQRAKLESNQDDTASMLYDLAFLFYSYTADCEAAEIYSHKALAAYKGLDELVPFKIRNLQIQIYTSTKKTKIAKQIIKDVLLQSKGIPYWYNEFTLRKLELLEFIGDWVLYLHTSREIVLCWTKNAHYIWACKFLIHKAQYALSSRKFDHVVEAITEFDNLIALVDPLKSRDLQVSKLIIHILYLIHLGHMNQVSVLITTLHSKLGTQPMIEVQVMTIQIYQSQILPFLMAYLVSGVAHLSNDSSRASIYFTEGIKAITFELDRDVSFTSPAEMQAITSSLESLKISMNIHLAQIYISRCAYVDAVNLLDEITIQLEGEVKYQDKFINQVMFNWALLFQATGYYSLALDLYGKLSVVGCEFAWISKANIYLLNISKMTEKIDSKCDLMLTNELYPMNFSKQSANGKYDFDYEVERLGHEIEPKNAKDAMILSLIHALQSSAHSKYQTQKYFKLIREHLLECIKASEVVQDTMLSATCLGLLGSLFADTNRAQARKMVGACLGFCGKGGLVRLRVETLTTLTRVVGVDGEGGVEFQELCDARDQLGREVCEARGLIDCILKR